MTLLHLQLFWGESQQTFLGLDGLPDLYPRQQKEFKDWCKGRRKILKHEVHNQPWVKVSENGEPAEVTLKPNGTAVETNMFGSENATGKWNIQDGYLFILLENDEKMSEYRIIGSANSNIHSAAEYVNGRPHGLMKLIQVKPK
ncbi:hypothetical protein L3Q72_23150 [Vibrio sp. JC009]|uniref:hypothetical protein n=1 Tax=Vibrio sp. JC009 TaxID=2912314 RepID=UPI0023AF6BA0|nr:hypothetical protein [Vibrio sp. JC009]WED24130.1 hypothetical protein L3Q72_23150 [Vibrio sp. JC009]